MTLPGPDYIYECINCKNVIKSESIISGNSSGMKQYSDGKQILPFLPDFPNFTKCEKCGYILFLRDMEPIDTYDKYFEKKQNHKYDRANYAKFLKIHEYVKSLKFYPEEETFIRQMIWWGFNDRLRKGNDIFLIKGDKKLWKENCEKLIELFDLTDMIQRLMIGELHRNLGNFDKCIEIINSLPEDFNLYKDQFNERCLEKNRCVFEIVFDD